MSKPARTAKRAARAEHRQTAKAARHRDKPPMRLIGAVTEIADQPPLIAISIATIAVGAGLRRARVARTGVRMLAAHLLATGVKSTLKATIDRTRPAKAIEDGHRLEAGSGAGDSALNSFPSGHTAGAVAVGEAIVHEAPSMAWPVRIAVAAIGAAQLPRGKHYVSDVIAGGAIGWLAERTISAALDAVGRAVAERRLAAAEAETGAHPS